jgi:hypothetical protein
VQEDRRPSTESSASSQTDHSGQGFRRVYGIDQESFLPCGGQDGLVRFANGVAVPGSEMSVADDDVFVPHQTLKAEESLNGVRGPEHMRPLRASRG